MRKEMKVSKNPVSLQIFVSQHCLMHVHEQLQVISNKMLLKRAITTTKKLKNKTKQYCMCIWPFAMYSEDMYSILEHKAAKKASQL